MTVRNDKALDIALGNYKVYKHTSPSGKVYIGITRNRPQRRWKGGHGYTNNAHFMRAIEKYGWSAFRHEIVAEGLLQYQAEALEAALIAKYDSTNPDKGYNRAPGGRSQSNATRAKISAALTGVPLSADRRERMSLSRKGRKLTAAHKSKISEGHRNNPKVLAHILNLNQARAGIPKTEEHRRKLSASQPKRHPVINLDTGKVYDCVRDAARDVNGQHPNIVKSCTGERSTAYGYRWAYLIIDEEVRP